MFNRVSLQSIRSHRDTAIKLERLTVFVGPNGTGKSTVLGMIERTATKLRAPLNPKSRSGGEGFIEGYSIELLARQGATACSCELGGADPWSVQVRWDQTVGGDWSAFGSIDGASLEDVQRWQSTGNKADSVRRWNDRLSTVFFSLDPTRIACRSSLRSSYEHVGDGSFAVIALLNLAQRRNKAAYDAVVRGMQQLVKSLQNVRAVVTTGNDAGVQLVYDFTDADDVPATAVSEGTLLATALLTALHSDDQPRVLLLDDIERGLHPTAQIRFMQQLKALLAAQPQLQIIATTHSPFILDALEPSQVRVFARRKDGSVAVKSLADHPMAKENEGALTTGQLWSLDDESSWVLTPEERGQ